jgi:ZIP family zinc transporter
MLETFGTWPVVWQALAASTFTWGLTALGAAVVFFFRDVSRKVLDVALGFTAGVMIAASFWSLLNPAIALSEEMGMVKWVPALVGFLAGAFSMRLVDLILPHVHLFGQAADTEGVKTSWRRTTLLVLAITLHNIPEGLAIGVAFGAVAAGYDSATLGAAIAPKARPSPCRCAAKGCRARRRGGTARCRRPSNRWRPSSARSRWSPCARCCPMPSPLPPVR